MTNESTGPGFTGRQPELAVLTAALDDAAAGAHVGNILYKSDSATRTKAARYAKRREPI